MNGSEDRPDNWEQCEMSIFSYVDNVLEQHFARLSGRDHEGIQKTKYRTVLNPGNHVSNLILTYR